MDITTFLAFTASFLLLIMSIYATMGLFGGKKSAPPLSFFSLGKEVDFHGLTTLSTALAKKEVKAWNQFAFGSPYIVAEKIVKRGKKYSYLAVPKGFESDLQGYLLLRGIRYFKVDNPVPIEAESILVSNFSFKSLGSFEKIDSMVMPIAHTDHGGAVVQIVMRGDSDGLCEINSRLATFGDDHEARRLFYMISGDTKAQSGSKKLEQAISLRLFKDKNVERF